MNLPNLCLRTNDYLLVSGISCKLLVLNLSCILTLDQNCGLKLAIVIEIESRTYIFDIIIGFDDCENI